MHFTVSAFRITAIYSCHGKIAGERKIVRATFWLFLVDIKNLDVFSSRY